MPFSISEFRTHNLPYLLDEVKEYFSQTQELTLEEQEELAIQNKAFFKVLNGYPSNYPQEIPGELLFTNEIAQNTDHKNLLQHMLALSSNGKFSNTVDKGLLQLKYDCYMWWMCYLNTERTGPSSNILDPQTTYREVRIQDMLILHKNSAERLADEHGIPNGEGRDLFITKIYDDRFLLEISKGLKPTITGVVRFAHNVKEGDCVTQLADNPNYETTSEGRTGNITVGNKMYNWSLRYYKLDGSRDQPNPVDLNDALRVIYIEYDLSVYK